MTPMAISGELDLFFERAPDPLCIINSSGYAERLNPAWREATGWIRREIVERPFVEFLHPDERLAFSQALTDLGSGVVDNARMELRFARREGGYRWFEWNVVRSGSGAFYVIARDISGYKAREAIVRETEGVLRTSLERNSDNITRLSHEKELLLLKIKDQLREIRRYNRRDDLTGLYNRRYLSGRLRYEFARARRYDRSLAVAVVGVDNLDVVQVAFTHRTADEVLKKVAELLSSRVRSADLVTRFTEDEFALVFPETSLLHAMSISDKLRTAVEEYDWRTILPAGEIRITVGMAQINGKRDEEELLSAAEFQLHRRRADRHEDGAPEEDAAPADGDERCASDNPDDAGL